MNDEPVEIEKESSSIPEPDTSSEEYESEPSDEDVELDDLKNRANQLNIKFHPSIGITKLREKIQEALDDNATQDVTGTGTTIEPKGNKLEQRKGHLLGLVRVRIACMDPMKKAHEGDFFTVSNSLVGTVKRYVPFNVEWHVPRIILNMIKEKEFNQHSTTKNSKNMDVTVSKLVPTYAVTSLDPLTPQEMKDLAQRQAMAKGQASE